MIQKRTRNSHFSASRLNDDIEDYLEKNGGPISPGVLKRGSPIAAHTSHGWVRGEIKAIRNPTSPGVARESRYIVNYVDYGSEGAHTKDDIIPLPKLFMKEPAQAIR